MPKIALAILAVLSLSGFSPQERILPLPTVSAMAEQVVLAQTLRGHPSTSLEGEALLKDSLYLVSVFVGNETGIEPQRIQEAWEGVPEANQVAIVSAVAQVGKPYRYAQDGPFAFDCSGLTSYAWGQAGIEIPHQSRRQIREADEIVLPIAGDLVYYPGHVGLYLGVDEAIVHAANRRTGVVFGEIHRSVQYGRP